MWRLWSSIVALVFAGCSTSPSFVTSPPVVVVDNVSSATLTTSDTAIVTWHSNTPGVYVVTAGEATVQRGNVSASTPQSTAILGNILQSGTNTVEVWVFPTEQRAGSATTDLVLTDDASTGGATAGSTTGSSTGSSTGATTGSSTGSSTGSTTSGGTPVFVGSAVFNDSASTGGSGSLNDATFAKPTGTTLGDFILVFFTGDGALNNLDAGTLSGEGWTLIYSKSFGADGQYIYLFYKFAGASEPTSYIFSNFNPGHIGTQGLLRVYRGVNATAPINTIQVFIDSTGANTANATTATPAVTTTAAHCLLIAGLAPDLTFVDAPLVTSWPVGFTQNEFNVINPGASSYGYSVLYSAEQDQTSAGSVAASAFAWHLSQSTIYAGALTFVLALAPP